jgi:short-subunit dehydrogenase
MKYRFIEKVLFPPTYINYRKLRSGLEGKTIIITGASSGIGEQLAFLLGDLNCHLILVARRHEKLLELQEQIQTAKVDIFPADLRNPAGRKDFLTFIQETHEKIDIFVNNAGLSIKRSIFDSLDRFHDFKRTMAINYFAPVDMLLSVIPFLEKSNGQIINVSTINTLLIPFPKFAAYQASKQAFDTWIQSAAPELNEKGIRTTSIYLPLVRTPMIKPTVSYERMPAMSAHHVAKVISKTMYTKRRQFKPWYIGFGQLASVLFRGVWERLGKKLLQKR